MENSKFLELRDALEQNFAAHEKRYQSVIDRLEAIESNSRLPGRIAESKEDREYEKAFLQWVRRRGSDPVAESKMRELEAKDVTVGSNAGGGYALPKQIWAQIEAFELKFSPVRRLVKVIQASTSDFHYLLNLRGTTSGWVSELGSRSASNSPSLRDCVPTHGELYAYPAASNWALDDLSFDVGRWLAENIADEFAYQEGEAVIRGNGSSRPTGMLNTTPVVTDDGASPLRAAAAYQYIPSVASPFNVGMDQLIDLQYKLNSAYRANGTYIMNSTTAAVIRKLKASTSGDYLWQPSSIAGQPDLLLGRPVEILEGVSDIGSGTFPVGFGDFSRGYLLVDIGRPRMIRDEITTPGMTKFFVSKRVGGVPLSNDAIKFIRNS